MYSGLIINFVSWQIVTSVANFAGAPEIDHSTKTLLITLKPELIKIVLTKFKSIGYNL